jgi:hypothetical protein
MRIGRPIMADTKTEKTAADELKTAVRRLLCECSFPVEPPYTLGSPGPCVKCEAPFPDIEDEPVPEALRKPLVAWLASAAWWAERRGAADKYALAVARVLNGDQR